MINYKNSSGAQNGFWNGGNCTNVTATNNTVGDAVVTAAIWDTVIPECQWLKIDQK
jgi:hypothetical protein